ncbi:hypothetical protein PROFUN_12438 [Planoprotostelium fungivorum]|uniref:Uncharacterized protein n=1 Tax=Planoprotostelium fungivorum TaxID=1890364 RepID=A0A2P6N5S7_9EUKA|nr:hypothetical protein PROFUN_12438 [Planoprotostelium fungivorum]
MLVIHKAYVKCAKGTEMDLRTTDKSYRYNLLLGVEMLLPAIMAVDMRSGLKEDGYYLLIIRKVLVLSGVLLLEEVQRACLIVIIVAILLLPFTLLARRDGIRSSLVSCNRSTFSSSHPVSDFVCYRVNLKGR